MKIVADRDIFRVEEYFSSFGDLVLLPGREITFEHIRDADALLIRTVTAVSPSTVENSQLRFIGSATSGIDHVDIQVQKADEIQVSHAPGCNADAVVNYVFSALAWLSLREKMESWRSLSVGIIGVGNIGGTLAEKLLDMDMPLAVHDPFLDSEHALAGQIAPLQEVLAQDVVAIHAPLTKSGPHPTFHMLDQPLLAGMKENAVLVNAARGEIIDNRILADVLAARPDMVTVLDVWEREPDISRELLSETTIATPHIAGYSLNGKLNATDTIFREFCRCFSLSGNEEKSPKVKTELPVPEAGDDGECINRLLVTAYPIERDFLNRAELTPAVFDKLRNEYTFRKEFSDYRINGTGLSEKLSRDLAALGFEIYC